MSNDDTYRFLGELADRHKAAEAQAAPQASAETNEPYKLARRGRLNSNWDPPSASGDSAAAQSYDLANARVRDGARNEPQFVKTSDTLTDLIIGCGVQAFSDPFSIGFDTDFDDARLDFELRYAMESDDWFDRWANDPKQCDAAGKQTWHDLNRTSFRELPEIGDAFLLRCTKKEPGRLVPTCYQQIEKEQLDRSKDRPASGTDNKIVGGIELDANNTAVAYHIFDAHPHDDYTGATSANSERIPAERVIHAFLPFRPSMTSGFSWFRAIAQLSRDRHWMLGNYLTKVAIDSLLTLVHYSDQEGALDLEGEESLSPDGKPEVRMAPGGQTTQLPTTDKVEMFQSGNVPPQQLPAFIDVLDHDAAAGVGLSHLRYTGRWSKLSYTAGRGAQLDDELHCKPLRQFWASSIVLPVRKTINSQMVAMGHIRSITARDLQANPWELNNFMMIGPGREMLDPEGEADSAKSKLGAGLSTLQLELGKLGLHWVRVLRQIRLENRLLEKLGLALDFSKGGGQQAGSRIAGESRPETKARIAGAIAHGGLD